MMQKLATCVALALAAAACGDDESTGSAPVLSNLQMSPDTVTAGQQVDIDGAFTFIDEDEDASRFAAQATTPAGIKSPATEEEARGAHGKRTGELQFRITLNPQIPGTYTLVLWMIDEAGNESNKLSDTIQAQ